MRLDALMRIDRRIIFLLMAVVIVVPLIVPIRLPMGVQKSTQAFFDQIESIDGSRKCLMISADYDPQTEAETQPMTVALLRHAFDRRIPVLTLSLYVQNTPLMAAAIEQTMRDYNAETIGKLREAGRVPTAEDTVRYGRDVAFLGWQPPPIVPILSMGESIVKVFPTDFYGNQTDTLAVMSKIHNYDQVGIVAAVSAGSSPLWYVVYAQPKFGVKVAAACTAVSAPDYYPYFETGQFSGIMGGMKGAAEYESLIDRKYGKVGRERALEGMGAQSAAHVLIMVLVIIGNVAYFAGRRKG